MSVANSLPLASQADEVATSLAAYLEALPPDDWARPSDCAGWTVAGVVAHLVLVEALLGSSIERGLQGDSGPPPEAAAGLPAWREVRAREVHRLSAQPPPELLADFRAGLATMWAALARLTTPEAAAGRGWHPTGQQELTWFAGQWLVEVTLHDWDLRVSADPSADVHPAALPGLASEMRARMPRCFQPESGTDIRGVVRIALSGSAPTAWLARLADGRVELLDDAAAEPDAIIQTGPGAYALVQTSRRPAASFKERGRWQVSGDGALAERLAAAFRGY